MQVRNDSTDPIILGGYHNGKFAEASLVIEPGQVVELTDERRKLYDAATMAKLVPASKKRPAPPKAPVTEGMPVPPDEDELERARLLELLRDANG